MLRICPVVVAGGRISPNEIQINQVATQRWRGFYAKDDAIISGDKFAELIENSGRSTCGWATLIGTSVGDHINTGSDAFTRIE